MPGFPLWWALALVVTVGVAARAASAQVDVRAWSAAGQVFVVWRVDSTAPLTFDVYRSTSPVTSTSQAVLVGRVFRPEWSGERLKLGNPVATWRVPVADGGSYQLAENEGLLVFTPHASASEFFSVVRNGSTAVSSANRTAAAVTVQYDPVAQPVACHQQLSGVTTRGYPYRTYAMWVDGRDDPHDARPDFPVMANAAKNGAPHVFTVFEPKVGMPSGSLPATVCLHGGGSAGSHWSWSPETAHYANNDATPVLGITVAFDDRLYISTNGMLNSDRPTNWFGWWPGLNPFTPNPPPDDAVVVPYTMRRLLWTMDWLQTCSPYMIDPQRVSVMGESMGGAGTLLISRLRPERFSAATALVPQHYTPETGQRLFGTTAQNLATTEAGPSGAALRVNDFFDAAVRLAPQSRDFCLTRIFRGRRDEAVEWGPLTIGLFNAMSGARHGTHLYWDNRDHTASAWTTDDPAIPGVDIGEWVSPVRTERVGAPYQPKYRANQSYPGFFDDDQDPSSSGRQPALGNGLPDDGAPWGTWGGYFDWDTETIFDTHQGWSCTLFLVGRSSVSVDNFPGSSATTSLAVRKPRKLWPAAGAAVAWTLRDDRTDAVLQSGTAAAESDGLVAVTGLVIPKDPKRARLEFRVGGAPRPGDGNGDGSIDAGDVAIMRASPADLDGDGVANAADADILERYVRRYACAADLNGNGIVNGADLGQLLAAWGACTAPCAADLDADGIVSGSDLGLLLAGWGACR
jgi:pimeloyl-ACP methyl ester carboxylesterase